MSEIERARPRERERERGGEGDRLVECKNYANEVGELHGMYHTDWYLQWLRV